MSTQSVKWLCSPFWARTNDSRSSVCTNEAAEWVTLSRRMLAKFMPAEARREADRINVHLGAVDRDRLDDADVDVQAHDRHVGIDQRIVQPRREDFGRPLGADLFGQHALVFIECRARALAVVERGVAGPAVAVAGDEALAVLPRRRGLFLFRLDDGGALLVALAAGELHALLVDRRGMAERHVVGIRARSRPGASSCRYRRSDACRRRARACRRARDRPDRRCCPSSGRYGPRSSGPCRRGSRTRSRDIRRRAARARGRAHPCRIPRRSLREPAP